TTRYCCQPHRRPAPRIILYQPVPLHLTRTGSFSSRFSPRLPGFLTPSPLAGEGWDGGEQHGLSTPSAFTPTLTLPRLRGREKDGQALVPKTEWPWTRRRGLTRRLLL